MKISLEAEDNLLQIIGIHFLFFKSAINEISLLWMVCWVRCILWAWRFKSSVRIRWRVAVKRQVFQHDEESSSLDFVDQTFANFRDVPTRPLQQQLNQYFPNFILFSSQLMNSTESWTHFTNFESNVTIRTRCFFFVLSSASCLLTFVWPLLIRYNHRPFKKLPKSGQIKSYTFIVTPFLSNETNDW